MSLDPLRNPVCLQSEKRNEGDKTFLQNMVIHTTYNTEQTASMHNIEKENIVRDILYQVMSHFLSEISGKKKI